MKKIRNIFKTALLHIFLTALISAISFNYSPIPAAAQTAPAPSVIADWTILSFLSADNDLEKNALFDINEMEAAGPAPNVNIIVQLDRPQFGYSDGVNNWGGAVRIKIQKDNDRVKITSPVVMKLGSSVNSGDPKTLADFIEWGVKNYPAQRYMLVLWSHGSGWKTIPYDQIARAFDANDRHRTKNVRNKYLTSLSSRPEYYYNSLAVNKSAAFARTPSITINSTKKIKTGRGFIDFNESDLTRSISYDDTSRSAITLNELSGAIKRGAAAAGLDRGFDIIWFDACLMSMIEVACELEGAAKYMIASEEVTPDFGWNHIQMVNAINKYYNIPTRQMAKLIVDKYVESYRRPSKNAAAPARDDENNFLPVTMGALDLSQARAAVESINSLVRAASSPVYIPAVKDALNAVQRFDDADYVDFIHFTELLENKILTPEFNKAALELKAKLNNLILLCKTNSPHFRNARGVSVYFPMSEYSSQYDSLKFSALCEWKKFIKTFLFPQNSEVLLYLSSAIYNANGDGRLSPDNNFELRVKITNAGSRDAKNAKFTLSTRTAGIKITNDSFTAVSIAAGDEAEIKFTACSDNTLQIGRQADFDIYYSTGGSSAGSVRIARLAFTVRAPFVKTADILFVQGANEADVAAKYADAFKSLRLPFDSWCIVNDGPICRQLLDKYKNGGIVFRSVSDSSLANKITRQEVETLRSFLETGGALCISGQDVGAMIGDSDFYKNYLKCHFDDDSGGTLNLTGCDIFAQAAFTLNGDQALNNQLFIDSIVPLAGAVPLLKYDNQKAAAVLINDGKYRAMYFAFGLEAVSGIENRAAIISKAVELLPFKIAGALRALKADAVAEDINKNTAAALNNIELTEKSIIADINNSNYDSAINLCLDVIKMEPAQRAPFKTALKAISVMLKAKLIQQQLCEEESEIINSVLSKISQIY